MSVPRSEIRRVTTAWVERAEEDLRLARHAFTLRTAIPYRLVAYHAQQCAEKYLKAYLVSRQVEFPFTHDIAAILDLVARHAPWAAALDEARDLTVFSTSTRYPKIGSRVAAADARRAVTLAEKVRTTVKKVLVEEGSLRPARRRK